MRAVMREDACVSNYAFDRWFSGELPADEVSAVQVHVESCARCSVRADELKRQRTAFYARVPSWQAFEKRRVPSRNVWRWVVPMSAAAAVLLAIGIGSYERQQTNTERAKGGPSIGFFVKRGEQIRRGITGEVVKPGELVRFTYSTEQPVYFALLHADAAKATVYYPTRAESQRVESGRDVPLDFSIRLDSLLGSERVYGVFCEQAIALEPVRVQLERTGRIPELPGCRVDPLVLEKKAP